MPQQIIGGSTPFSSIPPFAAGSGAVVDATGERMAVIGRTMLATRASSKVLSAAGGGSLFWRTGTGIVFSNAGTQLDLGLQDVDLATGIEDDVFDVSATLVGGTDTIGSSAYIKTVMESGSKTLVNGGLIAAVWDMISRGGTDAVNTVRQNMQWWGLGANDPLFPYGTALGAKTNNVPWVMFKTDDGTIGWIQGLGLPIPALTTVVFNSGSSPNEYCHTWDQIGTIQICGMGLAAWNIATADDFAIILYRDPYGSPVEVARFDADAPSSARDSGSMAAGIWPIALTTLEHGQTYGVTLKAETVNNISHGYVALGAGFTELRSLSRYSNTKVATRSGGSGAFSEISNSMGTFVLDEASLSDGVGGGGLLRHPGMVGGLAA